MQLKLSTLLMWLALATSPTHAAEIDFTRYLADYASAGGTPASHDGSFFGVAGEARLIITNGGPAVAVTIRLNGEAVVALQPMNAGARVAVPVMLLADNSIVAATDGSAASSITVRVKQTADVELNVLSRVHFNTNVSNFAVSREFYGNLGFETLSGFPDTNTLEMARAIGIETPTSYDGSQGEAAGGYLLHGELISVGGFGGGVIDLIEFTIPRNDEPPYAALNHLGMARAAMYTTDIDADYASMKERGVRFIAPPATRSNGIRFTIFTDPDGTYYELIEVDGEAEVSDTTHIVGLGHLNVNVSDFERSAAWYRMFGYQVTETLPPTDSLEVSRAMGFDARYEINGAILTHDMDESTLELVQWIVPHDPEPAYAVPVNHLGIHRTALLTSDIEADVAALEAQGVEFISEITPCCSGPDSWGKIVAFYDPDGTVVELVEQPFMDTLFRVVRWFRQLFS